LPDAAPDLIARPPQVGDLGIALAGFRGCLLTRAQHRQRLQKYSHPEDFLDDCYFLKETTPRKLDTPGPRSNIACVSRRFQLKIVTETSLIARQMWR
jgi:hypothetical protein